MPGERKPMRYAHVDGHTDVCYTDDGKYILTCGADGDVRIWNGGIEDDEPSSECVGEMALTVLCDSQRFYVGTDNNYVQAYSFPEAKRDAIIARFSSPVTHIDISPDKKLLACSSCDMDLQVIELNTNKATKFSGHTGPVLGVAIDPQSKYVVSSSSDGSFKIWDISSGNSVKAFPDMVPVCNDFFRATNLNRPAWKPQTGQYLALIKAMEVKIYERGTWELCQSLTDPEIKKSLSIAVFSPCGKYIAATSTIGEIIIWNVSKISKPRRISYTEHPKKTSICGLSWNPIKNELAFCDRLGELGVLENFVQEEDETEVNQEEETVTNDDNLEEPPDGLFDDDDEDNENVISLEKIKASTLGLLSPTKANGDRSSIDGDSESRASFAEKRVVPLTDIQDPFQPSSTPAHFQHRYMLWNAIGIVRCFNTEEERAIDVEFHDTIFHHPVHMNNYEDYRMASLSSKVLSLASLNSEDTLSKLTCVCLNAWDGSKEWSMEMLQNECIQALAASGDWVAVATDAGHLRIYSHAGTQRQILSPPGQIVSMAGHEQLLFVVCHGGMGLPGCQDLRFIIYEISRIYVRAITPCQTLPIFPKSTLKWIGFTDEGTPCTFDSEGILRFLSRDLMTWVVACDMRMHRKSKLDHYFVIGVSERYQNVRCILCKGSYYPMTTPRPTVIEIPLKLPFCEPDAEKTGFEDTFWRLIFSLPILESLSENNYEYKNEANDMEKLLKQTVIKLFANACRNDADMRAIDVATYMTEGSLEIAGKYASQRSKIYLADKLGNVDPVDWNKLGEQRLLFGGNRFLFEDTDNAVMESAKSRLPYSQDMFEDSSSNTEDNRLLAARRQSEEKLTTSAVNPTPPRGNPFKVMDKQDSGPKGLNFFDSVKPAPVKETKTNNSLEKLGKPKPLAKSKSTNSQPSQPKKQTFVEWFALQKSSLQVQYPEATPTELTKIGMKIFREKPAEKESSKTDTADENSQNSQDTQLIESKKRKLDEVSKENENKDGKQTVAKKLSLFAFNK